MVRTPRPARNPGRTLPDPDRQHLLQEALTFRGWGFSVFPLGPLRKPLVRWGHLRRRRPSDREVGRWFDRFPDITGIGVVAGRPSAPPRSGLTLCVMDFDAPGAYDRWAGVNRGPAAACPTVKTRRGFHAYCYVDGPERWAKIAGVGELIADANHFVAAPPSHNPKGPRHEWVGGPPLGVSALPVYTWDETGFLPDHTPPHRWRTLLVGNTSRLRLPSSSLVPDPGPDALPAAAVEAVRRAVPGGPGERNHRLHYLARGLKDVCPGAGPGVLAAAVALWLKLAGGAVGTTDFGTSYRDLCRAWRSARKPVSDSLPLDVMTQAAVLAGPDSYARLAAACRAAAAVVPGGVFHLSCRTAAKAAGVGLKTAAKMLPALVRVGALEVVEKGVPSATRRRATVYRIGKEAGGAT
ncbi:MAG: hypothetical protein C0501_30400 [Isosphaera sp.]|nr:hypothetical protein [Isosphaera sp.]